MPSYWDAYQKNIAAPLQAIDLYMKTHPHSIATSKAAELLSIDEDEVASLCHRFALPKLNREGFFQLMQAGSSPLCRYFRRTLECGLEDKYAPHEISYIFDIDLDKVLNGCKKMGIVSFDHITLRILLDNIPLP